MKRRLLDILACPMCKYYPLELIVFEEKEEVEEGLLICNNCNRWYPIIEAIPHMLPDDLRDREEDLEFLKKWQGKVPEKILRGGEPFNLEE